MPILSFWLACFSRIFTLFPESFVYLLWNCWRILLRNVININSIVSTYPWVNCLVGHDDLPSFWNLLARLNVVLDRSYNWRLFLNFIVLCLWSISGRYDIRIWYRSAPYFCRLFPGSAAFTFLEGLYRWCHWCGWVNII